MMFQMVPMILLFPALEMSFQQMHLTPWHIATESVKARTPLVVCAVAGSNLSFFFLLLFIYFFIYAKLTVHLNHPSLSSEPPGIIIYPIVYTTCMRFTQWLLQVTITCSAIQPWMNIVVACWKHIECVFCTVSTSSSHDLCTCWRFTESYTVNGCFFFSPYPCNSVRWCAKLHQSCVVTT